MLYRVFGALFCLTALYAGEGHELNLLREIAAAGVANMSDLCTVVLLQRGESEKYPNDGAHCNRVSELKIYKFTEKDTPLLEPVTAGAAAKAAIRAHGLERSLLFMLTGLEWYAVQNAEELGLLPAKTAASKPLSGDELLAVFEKALMLADEKAAWGEPKNPYEAFGVKSYEELNKQYDEATKAEKNRKKER